MKRGGPLERRTPLRPVGRKAARERAALRRFNREVEARAGGRCVAAGMYWSDAADGGWVCGDDRQGVHRGDVAHHRWPEDRDVGVHDPARGLWLCARAHRWVHDHPRAAGRLGLLRGD